MTLRPEVRHLYRGRSWREVRSQILDRAKGRCEQCRVPIGMRVKRFEGCWVDPDSLRWRDSAGALMAKGWTAPLLRLCRFSRYEYLQVAHLNQVPGDNRPENLKALCAWCHCNLDRMYVAKVKKKHRAEKKDLSRPLLMEAWS